MAQKIGENSSGAKNPRRHGLRRDGQKPPSLPPAIAKNIQFDPTGLIPVIAQDWQNKEVLMVAWMNEEALAETVSSGYVCYWSRSRQKLWRKGETSGQRQRLHKLFLDCDGDTLLLEVDQVGVACHTGRRSCFFQEYDHETGMLRDCLPVIIPPEDLYGKKR